MDPTLAVLTDSRNYAVPVPVSRPASHPEAPTPTG